MTTSSSVPPTRTKADVLGREFLEVRSRVLELAASLDRLDRAPRASVEHPDNRLAQLRHALEVLLDPDPGRAETVQRIFSLDYDPDWRRRFELDRGR
jgi:hypothetical protein